MSVSFSIGRPLSVPTEARRQLAPDHPRGAGDQNVHVSFRQSASEAGSITTDNSE